MRDIWEYELNLTPEEVWRMWLHVWEMAFVTKDRYYFFDENCAYNLLFFLEAGREGTNLTDGYFWVIPMDTVRAIISEDMVSNVNFRPSWTNRMEAIVDFLDKDGFELSQKIALGEIPPRDVRESEISKEQQAAILDLAYELIRYDFQRAATKDLMKSRLRTADILEIRSEYQFSNNYYIERPPNPEFGHESTRISIGGGYSGGSSFARLGIRVAYHSLIDNSVGYLENSALSVGDARFKYYEATEKFGLERFTLVDMLTLNELTGIFGAPSNRFTLGVDDRSVRTDRTLMTGYASFGLGVSFFPADSLLTWVLAVGELQAAGRYSSWFSVGYGVHGGMMYPVGSLSKLLIEGQYKKYTDSGKHYESDISFRYAVYPAVNHAISAEIKWMQYNTDFRNELSLSYMYYF
jgi:hypothetical protein